MVRVLHALAPDLPTSEVQQLSLLCEGLALRGFENVVCSFAHRSDQRERLNQVTEPVVVCPLRSTFDITHVTRFGRQLNQYHPDIIHYWGPTRTPSVTIANSIYSRVPMIECLNYNTTRGWFDDAKSVVVLRHSSNESVNGTVILGAIRSRSNTSAMRSLRSVLDVPTQTQFVGVVGDLLATHRFKDAIWAIDLIRVIHEDLHLVIFGDGRDKGRLVEFQNRIVSTDAVHFLPRRDAGELLQQCICCWHPSPHDDLSLLEPMSAGVPVIAAEGHASEARLQCIADGETGVVVGVGDCAEFARQTNLLMQDAVEADRLRQNARRLVEERFQQDEMVSAFVSLYERSLATGTKAA